MLQTKSDYHSIREDYYKQAAKNVKKKINARSINVYDATVPTRFEVRADNFERRCAQMASMGFRTPTNVPYRSVGGEISIDPNQFTLHTFRHHHHHSQHQTGANSPVGTSKESDKSYFLKQNTKSKDDEIQSSVTPVSRLENMKKNKELITLKEEIGKANFLLQQVKLGHSFFELLQKENEKKNEKLRMLTEQSAMDNLMQVRPMVESENDDYEPESDDELLDVYTDVNRTMENCSPDNTSVYYQIEPNTPLTNDMRSDVKSSKTVQRLRIMANSDDKDKTPSDQVEKINISRLKSAQNRPQTYPIHNHNHGSRSNTITVFDIDSSSVLSGSIRAKTSQNNSNSKKVKEIKKPYTPVYSSLLSRDDSLSLDKKSITRQLCVLIWILESTRTLNISANSGTANGQNYIRPFSTCFNVNSLLEKPKNNVKTNQEKLNKIEVKWNSFLKKNPEEDHKYNHNQTHHERLRHHRGSTSFVSHGRNLLFSSINADENNNESDKDNYNHYYSNQKHTNIELKRRMVNETPNSAMCGSSFVEDEPNPLVNRNHHFKKLTNFNDSTFSLNNVSDSVQDVPSSALLIAQAQAQTQANNQTQFVNPTLTLQTQQNYYFNSHNLNSIVVHTDNSNNNNNNINNSHQSAENSSNKQDSGYLNDITLNDYETNLASNHHNAVVSTTKKAYQTHNYNIINNQNNTNLNSINLNASLNLAASTNSNLLLASSSNQTTSRLFKMAHLKTGHDNAGKHKLPQSGNRNKTPEAYIIKSTLPSHEMDMIKIGHEEDLNRIFNKYQTKSKRRDSKSSPSEEITIQAIRTPKMEKFESNLHSATKAKNLEAIKHQFENVYVRRTINLHKRLEQILKNRTIDCQLKYTNLDMNERGIDRILEKMKISVKNYKKEHESKDTAESKYHEWYNELKSLVESCFGKDDIFDKLFEKLATYAELEQYETKNKMLDAKRQSEKSFLDILTTLRKWEILSPDVMSAVEFCREKVLKMKLESFEKWFKEQMPEFFVPRDSSTLTENYDNSSTSNDSGESNNNLTMIKHDN